MNQDLPSTKILGVSITTSKKQDVIDFIIRGLHAKSKKFYIVTPNPEIIVMSTRSSSYRRVLNDASVSLPDGIGVLMAGSILKKEINERIAGTDLMYDLCRNCAKGGLSIGLLGGSRGVAERTSECLREKYPDLVVKFASDEWPSPNSQLPAPNFHVDILFVAFGAPKQEEWIAKNLKDIPVTACMGVGGAFDYISGKVPRAPRVVRRLGMEWAYRLMRQPWRAKRQLALPVFAVKVLKEKLLGKS